MGIRKGGHGTQAHHRGLGAVPSGGTVFDYQIRQAAVHLPQEILIGRQVLPQPLPRRLRAVYAQADTIVVIDL